VRANSNNYNNNTGKNNLLYIANLLLLYATEALACSYSCLTLSVLRKQRLLIGSINFMLVSHNPRADVLGVHCIPTNESGTIYILAS